MPPTWLVTGSSGFLGTNAGLWLEGKARRVGVSRNGLASPFFDVQHGVDLRDTDSMVDVIHATRPDVILHAAAISGHETCAHDPDQAYAVNVTATATIAQAALDVGARLVYISTDAVFGGDRGNYTEDDSPAPFSYYGETKLKGEEAIRRAGGPALVARTNFFGWSVPAKRSVLEFFVDSLRSGEEIHGYPDFVVTSIYVRSLLDCLWRLNESAATGTVHVASRDALSKYDFGVEVARVFGLDAGLIESIDSMHSGHATSRSRDISLGTSRLESLLGTPPQTQGEGIRQASAEEAAIRSLIRGEVTRH